MFQMLFINSWDNISFLRFGKYYEQYELPYLVIRKTVFSVSIVFDIKVIVERIKKEVFNQVLEPAKIECNYLEET